VSTGNNLCQERFAASSLRWRGLRPTTRHQRPDPERGHEEHQSWWVSFGSDESLFSRGPENFDASFPRAVTVDDLHFDDAVRSSQVCRGAGVLDPDVTKLPETPLPRGPSGRMGAGERRLVAPVPGVDDSVSNAMATTEWDEAVPETLPCPICAVQIPKGVKKCMHCGEWIERSCEHCATPLRGTFAARGVCVECASQRAGPPTVYVQNVNPAQHGPSKSKAVAILLALTLGAFGAHRFYLGRPLSGFLYLLFSWTLIPALIAIVEAVVILCTDPVVFRLKYGGER